MDPIVMARRPIDGTVAENVLRHGCGGLDIDGCRVETDITNDPNYRINPTKSNGLNSCFGIGNVNYGRGCKPQGRWPSNLIHDGSDEVVGLFPVTKSGQMMPTHTDAERMVYGQNRAEGYTTMETYGDSGSAARFFYCPKASKSDRGEGNDHATVKPQDLIRYLIKLVLPPGGIVLDPFGGSGTLGVVCEKQGWKWVMVERDIKSVEIAAKRIEAERRQLKLF
jgi:site-specific DNA-methyltransferase (adenine-specific)